MKAITVINEKGGVGKTTLAVHLAFAAQEAGYRTLLVDLDSQGNASQFVTGDMGVVRRRIPGSEQIFGDAPIEYSDTQHELLKLLHGHKQLKAVDKIDGIDDRIKLMRKKIKALPFDYVIFDTPPAEGVRQTAPLYWSDLAVVALEPDLSSMSGLNEIIMTVKTAGRHNPALAMRMVINRMNKSSSSHKDVVGKLRQKFGVMIVGEFSIRVAVADALSNFVPVWSFTKDGKLKKEWLSFTKRVLGFKDQKEA